MKTPIYLISLFLLLISLNTINLTYINSKKTQEENKRRQKFKSQKLKFEKSKNKGKIIKKSKRKLQDDSDDDDEDLTASVYTRCDNGHTPDDISDCTSHETADSSCCLFTYGQDTGCVLIGFKYLGSKTVGDMVVNCESKFIGIGFISLFMMFILFLI